MLHTARRLIVVVVIEVAWSCDVNGIVVAIFATPYCDGVVRMRIRVIRSLQGDKVCWIFGLCRLHERFGRMRVLIIFVAPVLDQIFDDDVESTLHDLMPFATDFEVARYCDTELVLNCMDVMQDVFVSDLPHFVKVDFVTDEVKPQFVEVGAIVQDFSEPVVATALEAGFIANVVA